MSSQAANPNTEAAILARIIRAGDDPITPEVAQYLLSMRLPAGDEDRVNELSEKARAGLLTCISGFCWGCCKRSLGRRLTGSQIYASSEPRTRAAGSPTGRGVL